jgi:hypothetical protein
MRRSKDGPFTRLNMAREILAGLAVRDVTAAERLLAHFLCSKPEDEIDRHLEVAPRLPDSALSEAKLYADREAMLGSLPQGGVVGEVGTWRGDFSRLIVKTCKPDRFHLIDLDFSELGDVPGERHMGDSSTVLRSFPEGYFDWLYIDADHRYDGVRKDLLAAHAVLKPGGLLMCNDYTNWCSPSVTPYGVARAVNELIIDEGYAVEGLALHPAGLYDILIRKP